MIKVAFSFFRCYVNDQPKRIFIQILIHFEVVFRFWLFCPFRWQCNKEYARRGYNPTYPANVEPSLGQAAAKLLFIFFKSFPHFKTSQEPQSSESMSLCLVYAGIKCFLDVFFFAKNKTNNIFI